eukprot:2222614-Pleurochrysis_carterae.AAC.4
MEEDVSAAQAVPRRLQAANAARPIILAISNYSSSEPPSKQVLTYEFVMMAAARPSGSHVQAKLPISSKKQNLDQGRASEGAGR